MGCGASKETSTENPPTGLGSDHCAVPKKQLRFESETPSDQDSGATEQSTGTTGESAEQGGAHSDGPTRGKTQYSRRTTMTMRAPRRPAVFLGEGCTSSDEPAGEVTEKPLEVHEQISSKLRYHPLFESLQPELLTEVISMMEEVWQ